MRLKIGPIEFSIGKSQTFVGRNDQLVFSNIDEALAAFVGTFNKHYTEHQFIEAFESIPEVFAPIDTIATAVASGDYQLVKRGKGDAEDEIVTDNKYWNAFTKQANFESSLNEVIYEDVVYFYVTGNSYMYKYVAPSLPKKMDYISAIHTLKPQFTEPILNYGQKYLKVVKASDIILGYEYTFLGQRDVLNPEDVIHDKYITTGVSESNNLKGMSPLKPAIPAIENLKAVYVARNTAYTKHGALGFMVSKKTDESGTVSLTPTEREDIERQLDDSYGFGLSSKGKRKNTIAILQQAVDFVRVGLSIKELEPFKETDTASDAIYGVLSVPTDLKPRQNGATFENQKQAYIRLYRQVAIPKAEQVANKLTKLLGLPPDQYIRVSFEHVEILQEDKKERSDVDWKNNQTWRLQFANGVITLNTWIRLSGGIANSGNVLYDKLIYDMDDGELAKVKELLKIKDSNNGERQSEQGSPGSE